MGHVKGARYTKDQLALIVQENFNYIVIGYKPTAPTPVMGEKLKCIWTESTKLDVTVICPASEQEWSAQQMFCQPYVQRKAAPLVPGSIYVRAQIRGSFERL